MQDRRAGLGEHLGDTFAYTTARTRHNRHVIVETKLLQRHGILSDGLPTRSPGQSNSARTAMIVIRELRYSRIGSVTSMTRPLPLLHPVVFAIGLERLDSATDYLTALGFHFQAFELEQLGHEGDDVGL